MNEIEHILELEPCKIHQAIQAYKDYMKLPIAKKPCKSTGRKRKITPEAVEEWQRLRDAGMSLRDIASLHNVANSTVKNNTKSKNGHRAGKITPEQSAEMRRMRDGGMTLQSIADHFSVAISTIKLHCRRA